MKNQRQAAPAAAQQPEAIAPWLQNYTSEFSLVDQYLEGDKSVADQIHAVFAAKFAEEGGRHKGTIDGILNSMVVLYGLLPVEVLVLVYGTGRDGEFKKNRADQAIACAKEAGSTMKAWNREEAQRVIEAWLAKNPAPTTAPGARKGSLAMLSQQQSGNPAQRRFPLFYSFAYPPPKRTHTANEAVLTTAMQRAKLESEIAELEVKEAAAAATKTVEGYAAAAAAAEKAEGLRKQIADLEAKTESEGEQPEPEVVATAEPTLEEQIAEAEAEEAKAAATKTVEGYAAAAAAAEKAEGLRKQIAAQQTAPTASATPEPATAPAVVVPTAPESVKGNGADTLSLPQAVAACKAANANKRLKKVYARFENDDNFDDTQFVATVSALL